jgi:hypothetical protein
MPAELMTKLLEIYSERLKLNEKTSGFFIVCQYVLSLLFWVKVGASAGTMYKS